MNLNNSDNQYSELKRHASLAVELLQEAIALCDNPISIDWANDEAIDHKLDAAFGELLTAMDNLPKYQYLASQPED